MIVLENFLPPDIAAASEQVKAHFLKMIAEGQTSRWSEMCALQMPPGVRGTDRAVMQDRNNGEWLDKMPPKQARKILGDAKHAGISTSGKYYMSGLADKRGPGDPHAWIESSADILKVAKERNLHVNGIVDYEPREVEKAASKPLSNSLVKELSAKEKKLNPKASAGELKELVIGKYAPKHKRG